MNQDNNFKTTFIAVFLIAFIVGGLAGVFGSVIGSQYFITSSAGVVNRAETVERISEIESESATIDVVERASPSVVSIVVTKELPQFRSGSFRSPFEGLFGFPGLDFFFPGFEDSPSSSGQDEPIERQVGAGTGFIVFEDGLIITNKHVVDDEDAEYTVVMNDGKEFDVVDVLARDPILDIAVVKVDFGSYDIVPLTLADSDQLQIGQTVIAIGNALGEFSNTVTKGVVSGIGRTITAGGPRDSSIIEEAIQTDAAINPGNSGGPLLDLSGNVVGVNTAVSRNGQSIGFAIPINEAKRIIDSVEKYGKIVRPFLGVRYIMLNERIAEMNNLDITEGALVVRGNTREELAVMPGSPADKAGLEENDIITHVDDTEIKTGKSLARLLAKYQPGDTVKLTVLHDGDEKEVSITLDEFKE